jgi:DNA-directed RNA polymerase specialized sigma24 family protein
MSSVIARIAAEADRPAGAGLHWRRREGEEKKKFLSPGMVAHQFPATSPPCREERDKDGAPGCCGEGAEGRPPFSQSAREMGQPGGAPEDAAQTLEQMQSEVYDLAREEEERERRIYRRRTVAMLRRYLKYSMETGRLPSVLGGEFFRAKVTSYSVVTFEDRVIFVHDMEKCLGRLDEFSRGLIARHILQEHDQPATARLLHCTERTVRRLTPLALDQMSEILLDAGLMERLDSITKNSCQGGLEDEISVSDCEDSENKF